MPCEVIQLSVLNFECSVEELFDVPELRDVVADPDQSEEEQDPRHDQSEPGQGTEAPHALAARYDHVRYRDFRGIRNGRNVPE